MTETDFPENIRLRPWTKGKYAFSMPVLAGEMGHWPAASVVQAKILIIFTLKAHVPRIYKYKHIRPQVLSLAPSHANNSPAFPGITSKLEPPLVSLPMQQA